jgi:ATP-dependent Lon protease
MFSSTELIRKSKQVYEKILNGEIEKAVILRDGKPTFMLLDFEKYEKIMTEYDKLKKTKKAKKNTKNITTSKVEETEEAKVEEVKVIEENISQNTDEISLSIVEKVSMVSNEDENKAKEVLEEIEQEVQEGLEVLDNLDFDDEFRQEVERKVREKKEQELKEFWA